MTSTVCVLNFFSPEETSRSTDLRSEINAFLSERDQCRILGSGRSCMEPAYFDVEIAFGSERGAGMIVRDLKSTFASRCDLDIDWI
jgi:hypothetical protein